MSPMTARRALGDTRQSFEVLTPYRLIGDLRVAKRHPLIAVAQELHDAHQAHPSVHQRAKLCRSRCVVSGSANGMSPATRTNLD